MIQHSAHKISRRAIALLLYTGSVTPAGRLGPGRSDTAAGGSRRRVRVVKARRFRFRSEYQRF